MSEEKWSELANTEKQCHTLGGCTRCSELHHKYQECFHLKPVYQAASAVSIDREPLHRQGIKTFTRKALSELNRIYEEEASTSFTNALVKDRSIGLERRRKNSASVRRKGIAEKATITLLTGESKKSTIESD